MSIMSLEQHEKNAYFGKDIEVKSKTTFISRYGYFLLSRIHYDKRLFCDHYVTLIKGIDVYLPC